MDWETGDIKFIQSTYSMPGVEIIRLRYR